MKNWTLHDDHAEILDHSSLLTLDCVFANHSQSRITEGCNLAALAEEDLIDRVNAGFTRSLDHMDNVDCCRCKNGVLHKEDGCDLWFCGECGLIKTTNQLVCDHVISACSNKVAIQSDAYCEPFNPQENLNSKPQYWEQNKPYLRRHIMEVGRG